MSINDSASPVQLPIKLQTQLKFKILIDKSGNKTFPVGIMFFNELSATRSLLGTWNTIPSALPISSQDREPFVKNNMLW